MRALTTLFVAALLASCGKAETHQPTVAAIPAAITFDGADAKGAEQLKHGERLTWALGCRGCHGKNLQGQLWDDNPNEYGVTWSPNLTQSAHAMSEAQLRSVIFEGKHPRRPQLWSMPAELFQYLAEPDRAGLVSYLRTLKPAGESSPDPVLGPRAKQQIAAGIIKPADAMVVETRKTQPVDLGPDHALGRMITMVSCAECHGYTLQGKTSEEGSTPDLMIAAAYTPEEFKALTTKGIAKGNRKINELMVSVGKNRLSRLTQHEREALYKYLKARAEQPQ